MDDLTLMGLALDAARAAAAIGEVPVGAVLAIEGRPIVVAHNEREAARDPTAHAELIAIREAARILGRWRLSDATLVVTLEPCPMCAGAMVHARIARCVYGTRDPRAGAVRSLFQIADDARLNHRVEIVEGVAAAEAAELLSGFFQQRRDEKRRVRDSNPR